MSYGVIYGLTGQYRIAPGRTRLAIDSIVAGNGVAAGGSPDSFTVAGLVYHQIDLEINLSSPNNNALFAIELWNVTTNSLVQARNSVVPGQPYPADMYFGFEWLNASATDEYAFYLSTDPGTFYNNYAFLLQGINFRAVIQEFAGAGVAAGTVNQVAKFTAPNTVGDSNITSTPTAVTVVQAAGAGGSPVAFTVEGGNLTALAAGTECPDVVFDLARTVQFAAGALVAQRSVRIDPPTYAFTAPSVITAAATLAISGAPAAGANATITSAAALWVQSGNVFVGGAGVTSVTSLLQISVTQNAAASSDITNASAGAAASSTWRALNNAAGEVSLGIHSSGYIQPGDITAAGDSFVASSGGSLFLITEGAGAGDGVRVLTGGRAAANERVRVTQTSLQLGVSSVSATPLVFANATNNNTVTVNTGITAASYAVTLPLAQGGAGSVLTNDGTGVLSWGAAGTVGGGGTLNSIPRWSAPNTLTDSSLSDNGTNITGLLPIRLGPVAAPADVGALFEAVYSAPASSIGVSASVFSAANNPDIGGRRARGTSAAPTAVQSGDVIVTFSGSGYHSGGAFAADNAHIQLVAAENFSAIAQGTAIVFGVTPVGSTTTGESARITDGTLRIGVPSSKTGTLTFSNAINANLINLTCGTTSATYSLTLPTAQGGAGTTLRNDGAGVLTWVVPMTGTGTLSAIPKVTNATGPVYGDSSLVDTGVSITQTQVAAAAGSPAAWTLTAAAHTTLAAGVECSDVIYDLDRTVQFATGAIVTQRAMLIQAPTYAFVGASTITTAATVAITGAPTAGANATITSAAALWVQSGNVFIGAAGSSVAAAPLQIAVTANATASASIANASAAAAASAVWSAVNDAAGAISVGIHSSGYAQPGDITAAGDSFVMTADGSLFLITEGAGAGDGVRVMTGGLAAANERVRVTQTSLQLGVSSVSATPLVFANATNNNTVTVNTGVTSGSYAVTLPAAQGGANTFLRNDGAGVLTWAAGGASGTGTLNVIPKVTNATGPVYGDSGLTDTGAIISTPETFIVNQTVAVGAEKLRVAGAVQFDGVVRVGLASSSTGSLVLCQATVANTVTLQPGATSASYALTLPLAQGGANTFLRNDGAGVLTWAAGGASGTGTLNVIPKVTNATGPVYGDSSLSDTGVAITQTQVAAAAGSPVAWTLTAAAHTTLAAGTESPDVDYNLARTVQFDTGAIATQRAVVFAAPTYAFVGASTITTAATVAITGAPAAGANATITTALALWVQSGASRLNGTTTIAPPATPTDSLVLDGIADGYTGAYQFTNYAAGGGNGPNLSLRRARGSFAAPTAAQSNDILGFIGFKGYGATAFPATANAAVLCRAAENFTDAAQGAILAFETTTIGSASRVERARITDAGVLRIGLPSTGNGQISFANATNANTVDVVTAATAASYTLTLPSAQSVGVRFLQNDGSGNLSWVSAATGTGSVNVIPKVTNATGPVYGNSTLTDTGTTITQVQVAGTSGSPAAWTLTAAAHTTLAAGTESPDVVYNLSRTVQFATGALTVQRAFVITPPTYAFVGASVLSEADTFTVAGPPSGGANATISMAVGARIMSRSVANVTKAVGLIVEQPTGAASNLAVQFAGHALQYYSAGVPVVNTAFLYEAVTDSATDMTMALTGCVTSAGVGAEFAARRARGTVSSPTAIQSNDLMAVFGARGYGATGFSTSSRAAVLMYAAEAWTDAAQGTYLDLQTTAATTNTARTVLRMNADGSMRLGAPSSLNASIILANATNNNTVTLTVGVTSASYSITLPLAQGVANSVPLNNGSGVLTWSTSVQVNNCVTKVAAYPITDADDVIICDATAAPFSVTLPTAVGRNGKKFTVKRINAGLNDVTVLPTGAETIDGDPSQIINAQWTSLTVVSDNANWFLI